MFAKAIIVSILLMAICPKKIGLKKQMRKVAVIAEIGVNHNGNVNLAKKMTQTLKRWFAVLGSL